MPDIPILPDGKVFRITAKNTHKGDRRTSIFGPPELSWAELLKKYAELVCIDRISINRANQAIAFTQLDKNSSFYAIS